LYEFTLRQLKLVFVILKFYLVFKLILLLSLDSSIAECSGNGQGGWTQQVADSINQSFGYTLINHTAHIENFGTDPNAMDISGIQSHEPVIHEYTNSIISSDIMSTIGQSHQNSSPGSGAISVAQEALAAINSNNSQANMGQYEEVKDEMINIVNESVASLDPCSVSRENIFNNHRNS
jgi:hypothetical protein